MAFHAPSKRIIAVAILLTSPTAHINPFPGDICTCVPQLSLTSVEQKVRIVLNIAFSSTRQLESPYFRIGETSSTAPEEYEKLSHLERPSLWPS